MLPDSKDLSEFKRLQPRTNETASLEERKEAKIFIFKPVQEEAFAKDIKKIKPQREGTSAKTAPVECFPGQQQCSQGGRKAIPFRLTLYCKTSCNTSYIHYIHIIHHNVIKVSCVIPVHQILSQMCTPPKKRHDNE